VVDFQLWVFSLQVIFGFVGHDGFKFFVVTLQPMHANIQLRYNPNTGCEAPYYRLKESYRSVRGTVHSLIILNIGFEPALTPLQMRRIAYALTDRFANRRQTGSSQKCRDTGIMEREQS